LLKDKGYNHIPNALIIDSISNPFEDSINAQAFQQESAMVGVYTKMKPDSFKSQLQAVLTAFYEDIKGVQGASCCPKTKMVKRQFEDQEDAGTTPQDETGIDNAGGAAAAPAAGAASGCSPRRRGGACSCTCIC
jgi:hypothetical protein